jgi:ABC-type Mn2+/Zn2+ transport system ATPase subunit
MSIEVENLSFSYHDEKVLRDINFKIKKGEFVTILGPNGGGKTTLLKCLIGMLRPESGKISVFGYDPLTEKEEVLKITGYLPQRETISRDLPVSVQQVMSMPLASKNLRVSPDKLRSLLKLVGLEDKWKERFNELSGGQQQRVLIARALVNDPKLLLFDEPFNGVDLPSQEKIVELVNELRDSGMTVVAVVHNINPFLHHIDKVMLLNRKIIAFGEPEEVFEEENMIRAYGTRVPLVVCEEGYVHPLYGDQYG